MIRKKFIVDTSVLLYDKNAIHSFPGNDIMIPLVVLEELDKFKEKRGLVGENARYVNRFLDKLRNTESIDGMKTDEETDIKYGFILPDDDHLLVPEGFDLGYNDNIIIASAIKLSHKWEKVIIVTKDINLRVKCDAVGVTAEDYYKDHVEVDDLTTGYITTKFDEQQIDEFYEKGSLEFQGYPNAFVIAEDDVSSKSMIGMIKNNCVVPVNRKLDGIVHVSPRNAEQKFAIEALLDPNIPLVTLTGLAGSGKTFLALMAGLDGISKHNTGSDSGNKYERLIITRTLQPVGRDLGYLPGSMEEKMSPWMMPIFDNARHAFKDLTFFETLMRMGDIEITPIPYIRGRTFNDSLVIVDEAQNATIHELKTIITRIGTGSKIVLLGDVDQIDTPYIDRKSNGLSIVIEKFKNSKLAAHVNLSKGQRSDLASVASNIL